MQVKLMWSDLIVESVSYFGTPDKVTAEPVNSFRIWLRMRLVERKRQHGSQARRQTSKPTRARQLQALEIWFRLKTSLE